MIDVRCDKKSFLFTQGKTTLSLDSVFSEVVKEKARCLSEEIDAKYR